jgi:hypothetical protein
MLANSPEICARHQPDARGKVRLCTLEALDGRTVAARRARELAQAFQAELGGTVSATQLFAIDRASALMALAEDAKARRLAGNGDVSLEDLVRIDNAAARAVKALGIKPAAATRPPSIRDYLRGRGTEAAGASSAPNHPLEEKTHHGPSNEAAETWSEMWARPYEAPGGAPGGIHAAETHPRPQCEDGEAF